MKNSKKAQQLLYSYVIWVITLVVCSVVMYLAISSSNAHNNNIEKSVPELSYEFPKTFVNTFLMTKITQEEAKTHFGDGDLSRVYRVYDLIWLDTEESLSLVKDKYKREYLEFIDSSSSDESLNNKDIYELYKRHSNKKIDTSGLLEMELDLSDPDEISYDLKGNYIVTIKTSNLDYTKIYFTKELY